MSAQKRYDTTARAMALEAGSTMHEVFSAVRLWQLAYVQDMPEHALINADRLFTKKRWVKCVKEAGKFASDYPSQREHLLQLCFAILHSGEWYDDPSDTVRTMANMELASIHYVDERLPFMGSWPIHVSDTNDPTAVVGIEQPFDVVLLYSDGKQVRYIGTIDGLVYQDGESRVQTYFLDENKTASRLDAGWRASFDLSHQVSGYCAACTSVFGFPVYKSRVTGVKIKPTNKGEDVYTLEPLTRTESAFQNFGSWLRHTVDLFESNRDDFEDAPRYTHSCNRYFRPCALLPFCSDTAEGRKEQWAQMAEALPTPSERAVMEIV